MLLYIVSLALVGSGELLATVGIEKLVEVQYLVPAWYS